MIVKGNRKSPFPNNAQKRAMSSPSVGALAMAASTVREVYTPHDQGLSSPPLPPLHLASWDGCPMVVAALLDRGADLEAKDQDAGGTALHACVRSTKEETTTLECLKVLIQYEANVDAKDTNGETAIIIAAREGKAEHVKVLIAQIDNMSKEGMATIELIANRILSAREEFTNVWTAE